MRKYILGIDASNIRSGGGLTHLCQMLNVADPSKFGFDKVIVWSNKATLNKLYDKPWLEKAYSPLLEAPLPIRMIWQLLLLPKYLRKNNCHGVFSPGGILPFHLCLPSILVSQNLLPFEQNEAKRYGFSFTRIYKAP